MKHITKRNALITALLSIVLFVLLSEELTICKSVLNNMCIPASDTIELVVMMFMLCVSPFVIVLSFLHKTIFESWKRFAVWGVPTVAILTYLLIARDEATSGGFFDYNITAWILGLLYGIFVVTSLVIIIKSWIRVRRERT